MNAAAKPPSRRKARKVVREGELLQAALQLFVEKGFTATSAAEVAGRAGVSKGTVYLYHKSKEDLLRAVISAFASPAIAEGEALVRQHRGSMSTLLLESMTRWWQQLYDGPASAVIKLIMTEARNFPHLASFYRTEAIDPGERIVAEVVERGIASGEFRSVDVDSTVRSLLFPMVFLCMHKHSFDAVDAGMSRIDFQPFMRSHVGLVLAGIVSAEAVPTA